jgi:hypothetical protein
MLLLIVVSLCAAAVCTLATGLRMRPPSLGTMSDAWRAEYAART